MNDPADQLSAAQCATIWGIATSTWRDYVAEGRAPRPDGKFGAQNWWWRVTVEEALASRPGQGARTDIHEGERK